MLTNQYYDMITNTANTGFADHRLQHNHFIDTKSLKRIQYYVHTINSFIKQVRRSL